MGIVDVHLAAEGFDVELAQAVTVALDFARDVPLDVSLDFTRYGNRLPEAVGSVRGGPAPAIPRS
jgi:hypothetical protein